MPPAAMAAIVRFGCTALPLRGECMAGPRECARCSDYRPKLARLNVVYKSAMSFISVTRLRIRSVRFLPFFAVHALRSNQQVKAAEGFQGGSVLQDRGWTFWTMTAWDSQEAMRRYMLSGSHKKAMPHLMEWCDEASVVHWDREELELPDWAEADRRMRAMGRASKVRYPSAQHHELGYREPRLTGGGPIRPATPKPGE
jgi:hypothetical protein